jgi:RNA polymerase sigma-70 factor (ECF subfamily)
LKSLDDNELVGKVRDGDRVAFSELVVRHQKPLYQFLVRFMRSEDLAEDIVQDSFVRAYMKIHTFEERSSFKSWLYRIALNLAKNKLKRTKKASYSVDNLKLGETAKAESALIFEVVKKKLIEEVAKLPHRQKTALHLRIFEDLGFGDIALAMDCPYDTAKANYRHALLKLKEIFQQDEEMRNWLVAIDQEEQITELQQEGNYE